MHNKCMGLYGNLSTEGVLGLFGDNTWTLIRWEEHCVKANQINISKLIIISLFIFYSAYCPQGSLPTTSSTYYFKLPCTGHFAVITVKKYNIRNLYSALSWRSKRFTTLCGGLCQTAYLGAKSRHAVHNLIKENSRIHRCPQNRISDKPIVGFPRSRA